MASNKPTICWTIVPDLPKHMIEIMNATMPATTQMITTKYTNQSQKVGFCSSGAVYIGISGSGVEGWSSDCVVFIFVLSYIRNFIILFFRWV
jgi:hypothetical protein